jgi:hypothetical protein
MLAAVGVSLLAGATAALVAGRFRTGALEVAA